MNMWIYGVDLRVSQQPKRRNFYFNSSLASIRASNGLVYKLSVDFDVPTTQRRCVAKPRSARLSSTVSNTSKGTGKCGHRLFERPPGFRQANCS